MTDGHSPPGLKTGHVAAQSPPLHVPDSVVAGVINVIVPPGSFR